MMVMNGYEDPTVFDARYQFHCTKTRAALMLCRGEEK